MSYDDDQVIDDQMTVELGDTESILEKVADMIATAPNVPLSSTPRIDREYVVGLLQDALACLPDEIRQARWMLKERQDFMAKTQREADEIVEAARVQAERMVQRTEVVRAAEAKARQVLESANADRTGAPRPPPYRRRRFHRSHSRDGCRRPRPGRLRPADHPRKGSWREPQRRGPCRCPGVGSARGC